MVVIRLCLRQRQVRCPYEVVSLHPSGCCDAHPGSGHSREGGLPGRWNPTNAHFEAVTAMSHGEDLSPYALAGGTHQEDDARRQAQGLGHLLLARLCALLVDVKPCREYVT